MRISELSRARGVSVASIKYYTREGLIAAGERVGYNQTRYDDSHVARLKLIRALITGGGLSIAATQNVLAAVDDDQLDLGDVFAVAQRASSLAPETQPSSSATERVLSFVRDHGWDVGASNPGIAMVASALESFDEVSRTDLIEILTPYAGA